MPTILLTGVQARVTTSSSSNYASPGYVSAGYADLRPANNLSKYVSSGYVKAGYSSFESNYYSTDVGYTVPGYDAVVGIVPNVDYNITLGLSGVVATVYPGSFVGNNLSGVVSTVSTGTIAASQQITIGITGNSSASSVGSIGNNAVVNIGLTSVSTVISDYRTNLFLWSDDKSNAAWSKSNNTATFDAEVSPSGSATYIIAPTAIYSSIFQQFSVSPGQRYTMDFEVKLVSGQYVCLTHQFNGAATFDILNGVTSGYGGVITNNAIYNLGGGWYRIVATTHSSSTTIRPELWIGTYSGTNFTGNQVKVGRGAFYAGDPRVNAYAAQTTSSTANLNDPLITSQSLSRALTSSAITSGIGNIGTSASVTIGLSGVQSNLFVGTESSSAASTRNLTSSAITGSVGSVGTTAAVSVSISGNLSTSGVGSVTASQQISKAVSGNSSTLSIGSVTASQQITVSVSGVSTSVLPGSVGVTRVYALSGNSAVSGTGNIGTTQSVNISITGNSATLNPGIVNPAAPVNVIIGLIGMEITGSLSDTQNYNHVYTYPTVVDTTIPSMAPYMGVVVLEDEKKNGSYLI